MTCLFRFRYQLAAMSLLARGRAITMHVLSGQKKSVCRASHYSLLGAAAKSGLPNEQTFTVLGIETSCDDTGAAVVRSGHAS